MCKSNCRRWPGAVAALLLLRAGDDDEFGFVGAEGGEVVVFADGGDAGLFGGEFAQARQNPLHDPLLNSLHKKSRK